MNNKPFVVAFHPHQRRGFAQFFYNEDDLCKEWYNGAFKNSLNSCWEDTPDFPENATFEDVWNELVRDIHDAQRLDSPEEVQTYLTTRCHNWCPSAVSYAAQALGWLKD